MTILQTPKSVLTVRAYFSAREDRLGLEALPPGLTDKGNTEDGSESRGQVDTLSLLGSEARRVAANKHAARADALDSALGGEAGTMAKTRPKVAFEARTGPKHLGEIPRSLIESCGRRRGEFRSASFRGRAP